MLQEASYTLESANLFFHRNAGGGFFRRPPTLNLLEDFALLYAAALASLSAADEASASYSACQNAQIGRGSTCCGSEVEEDASDAKTAPPPFDSAWPSASSGALQPDKNISSKTKC